jgi:hypothetical protein
VVTLKNRAFARGEPIDDFPIGVGAIARRKPGSDVLQIIPAEPTDKTTLSSDWVAQNECRFCYTGTGSIFGGTWWTMCWDGEPDPPTVELIPFLETSTDIAETVWRSADAFVKLGLHLLLAACEGATGQKRR